MVCVRSGEVSVITESEDEVEIEAGGCSPILADKAVSFLNLGDEEADLFVYNTAETPSSSGTRICEEGQGKVVGPVPCSNCEDIFNKQCGIYGTCDDEPVDVPPCFDSCEINGEPVPTSTFFVDTQEANPGVTGPSANAGKTIPMQPSWFVLP